MCVTLVTTTVWPAVLFLIRGGWEQVRVLGLAPFLVSRWVYTLVMMLLPLVRITVTLFRLFIWWNDVNSLLLPITSVFPQVTKRPKAPIFTPMILVTLPKTALP